MYIFLSNKLNTCRCRDAYSLYKTNVTAHPHISAFNSVFYFLIIAPNIHKQIPCHGRSKYGNQAEEYKESSQSFHFVSDPETNFRQIKFFGIY